MREIQLWVSLEFKALATCRFHIGASVGSLDCCWGSHQCWESVVVIQDGIYLAADHKFDAAVLSVG